MATGPEHYLEAERLIGQARGAGDHAVAERRLEAAQVHATLALAAATALGGDGHGMSDIDFTAWDRVSGVSDPCPRCQGPNRETVDMVCQACGRNYGEGGDAQP